MQINRLRAGDEFTAREAIRQLKLTEERSGQDVSPGHMKRLLTRDENYLCVATVSGRPVGFLLAYRLPRIDRDQEMIYLYEIDVLPEQRRQGIGSGLIQRLEEECRSRKILKMWVGTETDNAAARALYESTGAKCRGKPYAEYTYSEF